MSWLFDWLAGSDGFVARHERSDMRVSIPACRCAHAGYSSLRLHDPNLVRLAVDPFEDHPPLIVDPDRVKVC
jgi:hypothetical protein